MSQIVNIDALPNFYAMNGANTKAADSSRIKLRMVFGNSVSLAVAECEPGYHPAPQIHNSEQINYVAEGELWVYIEGVAYHLRQGDAIRIPRMKMHWMWNRSLSKCVFYESSCAPLIGDAVIRNSICGLFDEPRARPAQAYPEVIWLSEHYAADAEKRNDAPVEGSLLVRSADLTTSVHSGAIGAAASGKLTSKCVHGLDHNMTIATRKGGYHSVPHIHDAEQIHFLVKGEIRIFTSDHGYDCRTGDFNIVPKNIPHWALVPTEEENILLQVHSPVLGSAKNRRALLTEKERELQIPTVFNMTPWGADEIMKVEEKHMKNLRRSGC